MTEEQLKLKHFFEENDFLVHLFIQDNILCAEIEKWTDGGVDMNILLNPFCIEEFEEYVNNFDMDEEIDMYRQDILYKNNFTITESLEDFTAFHEMLKVTLKKYKCKN